MSRQEDFIQAGIAYRMEHGKPMCIAGSNLADVERDFNRVISFEAGCEHGYQYALQHPQWIPVEERLPEENTAPLVRMDLTDKFGEETIIYDVVVFDGNGFHAPYKITHWMPIVPPRKED